MASTLSNIEAVARIADILGGLKINPDALKWPNDVPVAAVMKTITKQLDHLGSNTGDSLTDSTLILRCAFKDIALEDKELQVLKGISGKLPQPSPTLAGYRLPSELKREIDCIHLETQLLEEEAEQLCIRTQQIINASQTMSHDIRSLQKTHSSVRSTNEDDTGRMDDLSMQMDGTIADATQASYSLLSSFDSLTCHSYASSLEYINQAYSAHTDSFTSHLDAVETSRETFFTETSFDTEEFEDLFRRYAPYAKLEDMPSSIRALYQQEAYLVQVDHLCDRMEGASVSQHASDSGVIADALRLAGTSDVNLRNSVIPDARAEIEAAVTRDQIRYFDARGNFLDNATSVMVDNVMGPLDRLRSNLSLEERLVKETEVLCGVLHEEVGSSVGTVQVATTSTPSPRSQISAEIPEVPKDLGVQGWERELETRLRQYGPGQDELFQTLSSLNAGNRTVLDAIYANSPLNTSPPFTYSRDFTDLVNEARTVTAQLVNETDRLTKEVENGIESRRTQRKLGAFVNQWVTA